MLWFSLAHLKKTRHLLSCFNLQGAAPPFLSLASTHQEPRASALQSFPRQDFADCTLTVSFNTSAHGFTWRGWPRSRTPSNLLLSRSVCGQLSHALSRTEQLASAAASGGWHATDKPRGTAGGGVRRPRLRVRSASRAATAALWQYGYPVRI